MAISKEGLGIVRPKRRRNKRNTRQDEEGADKEEQEEEERVNRKKNEEQRQVLQGGPERGATGPFGAGVAATPLRHTQNCGMSRDRGVSTPWSATGGGV